MKCGDVIACKNKSLLSCLIKWFTKSEYSHLGVVYEVMECGDVFVAEINWNYTFSIREMKYDSFDVYRYDGEIDIHKLKHEIMKYSGTRYDYLDILRIALRFPRTYKTPKRMICSEIVDTIFANIGCDLEIEKEAPTPEEVVRSNRLKKVGS